MKQPPNQGLRTILTIISLQPKAELFQLPGFETFHNEFLSSASILTLY